MQNSDGSSYTYRKQSYFPGKRCSAPLVNTRQTSPSRPSFTSLGKIRTVRCRPAAALPALTPRSGASAMVELRHATAVASRASGSPSKRDAEAASASSSFVASPRGSGKDGPRASLPPPVRSLLALEDPRSPAASASYRILVAAVACLALAALLFAPSVWLRLNAPYL